VAASRLHPIYPHWRAGKRSQLLTYGNDASTYHKHTGTLTDLVQAMGVDLGAVGRPDAAYQRGPVPELLT
jgi:hypothetical protein